MDCFSLIVVVRNRDNSFKLFSSQMVWNLCCWGSVRRDLLHTSMFPPVQNTSESTYRLLSNPSLMTLLLPRRKCGMLLPVRHWILAINIRGCSCHLFQFAGLFCPPCFSIFIYFCSCHKPPASLGFPVQNPGCQGGLFVEFNIRDKHLCRQRLLASSSIAPLAGVLIFSLPSGITTG